MRKIPDDVKDLLTGATGDPEDLIPRHRRDSKIISGFIGAGIGAVVGFLLLLVVFGLLGGNRQAGLAAIFFGVPFGGWIGAEIGARQG